jgi:hypothetical protein
MNDQLFDALDRLVPDGGEQGDWQAILGAAGLARRSTASSRWQRRLRPTPARILVVCVVIAVTVIAATPAFGLRELIVDLVTGKTAVSFEKSRSAPAAIKQRFLDLAIGAPRGMNPKVLPAQARQITFLTPAGHKRVIWVAPTRGGGFCSIGTSSGGCISKTTEKHLGPVTINGELQNRNGQWTVIEVSGYVFSSQAATLTLEFADHQSMQLPFVYISNPINAGFYALGLPSDHQHVGHWPTKLIARNKQGTIVGTASVRTPPPGAPPPRLPPRNLAPEPPQALPTAATVTPTAPLQTASADGMTVVAGADGAVRFRATGVPTAVRRLLRGRVSFSCFRLVREFGISTVRGLGDEGAYAPSVGLTLSNVGHPLDGCEVDSARGHRWPDALGSHSPIEIAFTAKGRAYFADRAAARDLALFVRSARMQEIRKEPRARLLHDMTAAYGAALARSRIHYTLTPGGITFTEQSTTGKVFRVIVQHGRVRRSNISPYSKVF